MVLILNRNIPDFYFAAFAEANTDNEFSLSLPSKSVWVNRKQLNTTWRSVPVSNLIDRLKRSEPNHESDEALTERLSDLAVNYAGIIQKIHGSSDLEQSELFSLSFLVLTLLANAETPKYRRIQGLPSLDDFSWDKFESSALGAQVQSQRTRDSLTLAEGDLLDHGMYFILNRSDIPFITSDRAIFVDSWVPQEAQAILGALDVFDTDVKGSIERVIVLPLSPETVLISSAFLSPKQRESRYVKCVSDETIFNLNLIASRGAERMVISNKERPFGPFEDKARSFLSKQLLG